MREWLKQHPIAWLAPMSLFLGMTGFAVAWGAWHLYQDHQTHHQLVTVVNQLLQSLQPQQQAHPPAVPPR